MTFRLYSTQLISNYDQVPAGYFPISVLRDVLRPVTIDGRVKRVVKAVRLRRTLEDRSGLVFIELDSFSDYFNDFLNTYLKEACLGPYALTAPNPTSADSTQKLAEIIPFPSQVDQTNTGR